MPNLSNLISTVEKNPVLYEKNLFQSYHIHENVWEKVASKCGIRNGREANQLWRDLVQNYIEYLRNAKTFIYSKEMLFVQSHLINIQSDSDELDENELQRILDSESSETSDQAIHKKQEIVSSIEKSKPSRKRKKSSLTTPSFKTTQGKAVKTNVNADSTIDNSVTVSSNISDLSSLQLIFLGYAKILQALPLPLQIKTKHKIGQIINEAEMSMLDMNDSSNSSQK